jgi:hypothetical protein
VRLNFPVDKLVRFQPGLSEKDEIRPVLLGKVFQVEEHVVADELAVNAVEMEVVGNGLDVKVLWLLRSSVVVGSE